MNIDKAIDSIACVENAAGIFYLAFPYTSAVGNSPETLTVRVPIHSAQPSAKDKTALAEAVAVQGALGEWVLRDDGGVSLVSKTD